MKKVFDMLTELIFWIAIFASPFLLSVAIGTLICISNESLLWLSIIIVTIGFFAGLFLAERIRKKYGCSNYMSKIFS
jgi:hypothetical protein